MRWTQPLPLFLLPLLLLPAEAISQSPCQEPGCTVIVGSVEALRDAIGTAPAGAVVRVLPGEYLVQRTIDIARDDLTIEGSGPGDTIFRLMDGANEPVFVLGEPVPFQPGVTRRNLTLRRLRVDGNRDRQTGELSDTPGREFLRNNCVTVRQADNVLLEDLLLERCASGGMIAEQRCRFLTLRHVESRDHAFDGVAWDGVVTDSVIENSVLHSNLFAGLSFDIGPADNLIRNVQIVDNGRVGIFLRDSDRNQFVDLTLLGNGEHGVFISDGDDPTADAVSNLFRGGRWAYNRGFGIVQDGERSRGNRVEDLVLQCNRDGPLRDKPSARLETSGLTQTGCSCQPDADTLCLTRGRFEVETRWRDFFGETGKAQAVDVGRDDSGLFWFFDERNLELLVKVLDGCALPPSRFWVFFAATTHVEYTVTVTDTVERQSRAYTNPLGRLAQATADTNAFATCP